MVLVVKIYWMVCIYFLNDINYNVFNNTYLINYLYIFTNFINLIVLYLIMNTYLQHNFNIINYLVFAFVFKYILGVFVTYTFF